MNKALSHETTCRPSPIDRISVAKGIKLLFGATIAVIVLGALLGVALSWRQYINASRTVDLVALDRTLFISATETRNEIGTVGIALLAEEDARPSVERALHRVSRIYDVARQAVERNDFPGDTKDLAALEDAHSALLKENEGAGEQAALARSLRDVAEIEDWRQAIYVMSRSYVATSVDVGTEINALTPALAELVTIRELSFSIRDRYSRQCSAFRRAIARDEPLTQAQRDLWQLDIGAYQELWRRIAVTAAHLPQYPQLSEAVRAGTAATHAAQAKINSSINSLAGRGQSRVEPQSWAAHCYDTYAAINDIGHMALDLGRQQASYNQKIALASGSAWTLFLLAALIFSYMSSNFLRHRFSRPMASLTASIKRLEGGDYQSPVPTSGPQDEPGAIAATLESLRVKVLKADSLRRHLDALRDDLVTHARESNRAKTLFLATVSHEIRTPLNGILGTVQLLAASDLAREQKQWVEALDKSAGILRRLVDNVLDYSRLEAGKFKLERTAFRLSEQIGVVEATIAPAARQKGLDFSCTIDDGVPDGFVGDPAKIAQVLLNLLGNAVKFTETGSIWLRVRRKEAPVPDATGTAEICFIVTDTGVGIPQSRQAQLYEPFIQAEGAANNSLGGSGLGLTICRGLLQLMGGSIDFRCPPEGGTVFQVCLPLTLAAQDARADDVETGFNPIPQLHVLIAEDNAVNAMIADEILTRSGHTVQTVSDGKAALDAATDRDFDVILMDLSMPVLDGIEATRRIRSLDHETRRMVPVVALTADLTAEQRLSDADDLFDTFLGKPFRREDLDRALARAIGLLPRRKVSRLATDNASILAEHARDLGVEWARKIVELYLTETPLVADSLALALRRGDLRAISASAHRLKGGASHVGAQTLAEMAEAAERAADVGDRVAAAKTGDDLLSMLEEELRDFAVRAERELDEFAPLA
ncbi:ATP-binding protein [Breoghania sp.]|uniref:ATP-binding protein n=1 Tax=Breoghania sp. TaxID=2065378 RepID=UPI0029CA941C|nr:ATP-binding protein [Breoghania sp.]